MSDTETLPRPSAEPPPRPRSRHRLRNGAALAGAVLVGAGLSAAILGGQRATVVALAPLPVASLTDGSRVAIKGEVAEIFGNRFVLQDGSGRALVDTGPAGEGGSLVAKAESVTVQGRFEHGALHAEAVTHADGRTDLAGPSGPGHDPVAVLGRLMHRPPA